MKKTDKISLIIIIAAVILAWIILAAVLLPAGEIVPWAVSCSLLTILCLLPCALIYFIPLTAKKKFYKNLKENGFDTECLYVWENTIIGIDFDSKRFACNKLMVNPIVPFSDIKGCEVDVLDANHVRWTEASKKIVRLVISVKLQGNSFDYFFIPIYKVITSVDDFGTEDNEITESKSQKYPDLHKVVLLKTEIEKIVYLNKADGVTPQTPSEEEWAQYLKSTTRKKFII